MFLQYKHSNAEQLFASWPDVLLSLVSPNRHSTLLLYPMTILIPEHVPIRSHWPSGNAYPPGNDSLIAATIDSPPDICSFFLSHDQTLDPLHCFILWPFPLQNVFVYAVIGLRVFRIHQAITVWLRRQSIRHLTGVLSFHRTTKLSIHFIALFYDLFHHRACLYTQSLAFGYSVSTRR